MLCMWAVEYRPDMALGLSKLHVCGPVIEMAAAAVLHMSQLLFMLSCHPCVWAAELNLAD